MSKYKFKITYRNEDEYGHYWGDNRYIVSIIAETLEQAEQKLDEIEKNGYRMHKNILEWEAEEITEEKDIEIERLNNQLQQKENIIKEVREYIEEHSQMTDLQIYGIENVLSFRGSVEELLEILDKGE